jgi:hypothetical protein
MRYEANKEKYRQNLDLMAELVETSPKLLVEACPDRIWGIGVHLDDPRLNDPKNWTGKNCFGKLLTAVRDEFIKDVVLGYGKGVDSDPAKRKRTLNSTPPDRESKRISASSQ